MKEWTIEVLVTTKVAVKVQHNYSDEAADLAYRKAESMYPKARIAVGRLLAERGDIW
jgi:hypothetical protein